MNIIDARFLINNIRLLLEKGHLKSATLEDKSSPQIPIGDVVEKIYLQSFAKIVERVCKIN